MPYKQALYALVAMTIALSLHARITIHPQSAPTTGGKTVYLSGDGVGCHGGCQPPKVFFAGIESPEVRNIGPGKISAVTPAYPREEIVDVRVVTESQTLGIDNDFAYEHERVQVLVPVSVESFPGRSRWSSELWVYNGNDSEVTLQPSFCFGMSGMFPCGRDPLTVAAKSSRRIPAITSGRYSIGGYLYVPRELEPKVSFQLHVSSNAGSDRVEVPVVRAPSRRHGLTILNVPAGTDSRALLRVYTLGEALLDVRAYGLESGALLATQRLELYLPTDGSGPESAPHILSTSGIFDTPEVRAAGRVRLEVQAHHDVVLWGMVTVTNDVTGRVTLFTPQ